MGSRQLLRMAGCAGMILMMAPLCGCGSPERGEAEPKTHESAFSSPATYFDGDKWRALDTRASRGPLTDGEELTIPIWASNSGGDVLFPGIAVTVTVTETRGSGFVSAYAGKWPGTSTLNYTEGQTVSNTAVVMLAPSGEIRILNVGGQAHVIVDVQGYFDTLPSDRGNVCTQRSVRLFDTRLSGGKVPAGRWLYFDAPQGTDGGLLNVTVTEPEGDGYVSLDAVNQDGELMSETDPPTTSVSNFNAGETRATSVFLHYDHGIAFYSNTRTHLMIDQMLGFGWYCDNPAAIHIDSPVRILDTRKTGGSVPWTSAEVTSPSIPMSASALLANVTVLDATALTYVGDVTSPDTSIVNALPGQVNANFGAIATGALGDGTPALAISVGNPGYANQNIVVDSLGYVAP